MAADQLPQAQRPCGTQHTSSCAAAAAEEAYTDELIEQILENYTFKFEPEVRLKLKHRLVGWLVCGKEALHMHAQPNMQHKPAGSTAMTTAVAKMLMKALCIGTLHLVCLHGL